MAAIEISTLGRNIYFYRMLQNLSQHELTLRSGVPQGSISELETGKTQDIYLTRGHAIAKGLGVTVEDLLSDPSSQVATHDDDR